MQKLAWKADVGIAGIWGVGSGGSGIFCNSKLDDKDLFTEIAVKIDTREVADLFTGGKKAVILTKTGEALEWGEVEGEDGKPLINPNPRPIFIAERIEKVACGWAHALFLTAFPQSKIIFQERKSVYGLGDNKCGQIGRKEDQRNFPFVEKPRELTDLFSTKESTISDIFGGFRQSFFLIQKAGESVSGVYACGYNKFGELAIANCEAVKYPSLNQPFSDLSIKVKKIATGHKFTCILGESGSLFGVGENKFGQLGEKYAGELCEIQTDVLDFSLGWNHIIALKSDGKLYTAGRGNFGQQGLGNFSDIKAFTKVAFFENQLIKCVSAGSEANYCLTDQGLYSWGWNEHGNLGLGDRENKSVPAKTEIESHKEIKKIVAAGAVCFVLKGD